MKIDISGKKKLRQINLKEFCLPHSFWPVLLTRTDKYLTVVQPAEEATCIKDLRHSNNIIT
jgi:hypothetical protein